MTNKMKQSLKMDAIPFSGIRKVFEAAGKLEKEGKEIINLGIGRPNFDTPAFIRDAAKKPWTTAILTTRPTTVPKVCVRLPLTSSTGITVWT